MATHLDHNITTFLQHAALHVRIDALRATTESASGHPTSCLSAADLIATLFFKFLKFDYKNPGNQLNDRFILSKGHAIPVVYAAWKNLGIISDEQLLSLRKIDSPFEGHPTPRFPLNEAATGSLGQGLSVGLGMALHAKMDVLDYTTYVMMGDGELAEGSIWEAAELAAHYKANNLIGIVDCNRLGQSGPTLHQHDVERYAKKFESFGWHALCIDGHDINQIITAITTAQQRTDKPAVIIAKTYKGYGIEHISNHEGWHGKPLKKDELDAAINELKKRFDDVPCNASVNPVIIPPAPARTVIPPQQPPITLNLATDPQAQHFDQGKKVSTRKAYGYALAALGRVCNDVVVVDADVKNSTFSELFEKEFSDRFIQCFIAEQNMIGVSSGLISRHKIACTSTFGAFFSRAFDQIRMAGIGRIPLRLCGSHCGVSIGQDGPSQMALEDIAMISTIPQSIILYPSDGVSSYKLTELAANYHTGISYLRTTRGDTPIIYAKDEPFALGGCKVLRQSTQDQACLVAAGITVHEALKAHDTLKQKGISVAVIDLYSVKPLDAKTLIDVAKKAGNHLITIEDHYLHGGIGHLVAAAVINHGVSVEMLAVTDISRSGAPDELLHLAGIDAESIVRKVID